LVQNLKEQLMRRYRKWVMTLGMLAMTPGLATLAPPLCFGSSADGSPVPASAATKSRNQKVAEDIGLALKRANFHGYEINIEYRDGIATLRGKVSDPRQKARASRIVSAVAGVHRVANQLTIASTSRGPIRQVSATEDEGMPQGQQGGPQGQADEALSSNQQKAMEIGRALQGAGLIGYDIEVLYQSGGAMLRGMVGTEEQRLAAERVARSVSGVQVVSNQLRLEGAQGPSRQPQYLAAAYQPGAPAGPGGPPGPSSPLGPGMGGPPMGPPMNGPMSGVPMGSGVPQMGMPMPATGPMPQQPVYDNPRLPEGAWPSYAQYPNYAGVTYPSQYSASAWPYIGPFYPYPQVPLNWRKVSLEWDDGHWDLKFDSKTDRWWWFMNPKNW
jgi:osmotically-inducible protein OsmY